VASASTTTPVVGETPQGRATLSPDKALRFEREIIDWTNQLFESATEEQSYQQEIKETLRLVDYVYGNKHWAAGSRYSRQKPVLPIARRHAWETASLLTDLALEFQVKNFDHADSHSDFEDMLNQLATHWALRNYFEARVYDVVMYGMLHTGPSKLQWNSTLNGGMGDVQLVPIAPWQFATLGCGTDTQEAECVIYYPVVTKDHLVRRFGRTAERVECDADSGDPLSGNFNRPANISKQSWSAMGPALKRSLGVRSAAGTNDPYPKAVLREFWFNDDSRNELSRTVTVGPSDSKGNPIVNWAYRVEPGEMLYPRGRVICTAGGCVMEDAPNPYWHAKKPFPVYRPLRLPWQMSGESMLKPWTLMNTTINKIMGGTLDSLYSINEPTLIAPKGAFPAGDWESLDPGAAGGKIKVNNNSPWKPDYAKKAEFPFAPAMQINDSIKKEMDMSSGASAMAQALNKKQVPGGDSLEMILSSRSLPVRLESRSLTYYVEEVGFMGISDMLQFYSVAHRVAILGAKGILPSDYRPIYSEIYNADSGMKPEEFVRRFQFTVKPDSTLASQRTDKIPVAMALRKQGDLSSRGMFNRIDPGFDYDKNEQELIHEAKIKLALGALNAAATGKKEKKK
jgi:hypothetical protein